MSKITILMIALITLLVSCQKDILIDEPDILQTSFQFKSTKKTIEAFLVIDIETVYPEVIFNVDCNYLTWDEYIYEMSSIRRCLNNKSISECTQNLERVKIAEQIIINCE